MNLRIVDDDSTREGSAASNTATAGTPSAQVENASSTAPHVEPASYPAAAADETETPGNQVSALQLASFSPSRASHARGAEKAATQRAKMDPTAEPGMIADDYSFGKPIPEHLSNTYVVQVVRQNNLARNFRVNEDLSRSEPRLHVRPNPPARRPAQPPREPRARARPHEQAEPYLPAPADPPLQENCSGRGPEECVITTSSCHIYLQCPGKGPLSTGDAVGDSPDPLRIHGRPPTPHRNLLERSERKEGEWRASLRNMQDTVARRGAVNGIFDVTPRQGNPAGTASAPNANMGEMRTRLTMDEGQEKAGGNREKNEVTPEVRDECSNGTVAREGTVQGKKKMGNCLKVLAKAVRKVVAGCRERVRGRTTGK